jgi:hypothetical protein
MNGSPFDWLSRSLQLINLNPVWEYAGFFKSFSFKAMVWTFLSKQFLLLWKKNMLFFSNFFYIGSQLNDN